MLSNQGGIFNSNVIIKESLSPLLNDNKPFKDINKLIDNDALQYLEFVKFFQNDFHAEKEVVARVYLGEKMSWGEIHPLYSYFVNNENIAELSPESEVAITYTENKLPIIWSLGESSENPIPTYVLSREELAKVAEINFELENPFIYTKEQATLVE